MTLLQTNNFYESSRIYLPRFAPSAKKPHPWANLVVAHGKRPFNLTFGVHLQFPAYYAAEGLIQDWSRFARVLLVEP